MTALAHQARRGIAPGHVGHLFRIETVQQLDCGSVNAEHRPRDLALNDQVRIGASGFQRQLLGIQIEAQIRSDALDRAGTVDEIFRRHARLDQPRYWRHDPDTHNKPPAIASDAGDNLTAILSGFPSQPRGHGAKRGRRNIVPCIARDPVLYARPIQTILPLHRVDRAGERARSSCHGHTRMPSADAITITPAGIISAQSNPTTSAPYSADIHFICRSESGFAFKACSSSVVYGVRSSWKDHSSVASKARGRSSARSCRALHVCAVQFSAGFARLSGQRKLQNNLPPQSAALSALPLTRLPASANRRRDLSPSSWCRSRNEIESRSESNNHRPASTGLKVPASALRVGERSADFATARMKYSASVVSRFGALEKRSGYALPATATADNPPAVTAGETAHQFETPATRQPAQSEGALWKQSVAVSLMRCRASRGGQAGAGAPLTGVGSRKAWDGEMRRPERLSRSESKCSANSINNHPCTNCPHSLECWLQVAGCPFKTGVGQ